MYLDPTGHWEEGDDNLSRNGQLLTQYYGILWREATTQEEKDRYHGYAIAVRAYEANKSGGVFNHLVMEGSYTKSDLRSLQQLLKDEKYDIKVDGIWGNETANVLWAYQFKHFSEAKEHDEKAGKKTWATFLPSLYDNMNITEYYNHVVNKIASVTATVERSGATPVQTNPYESVNKSNSSQGTSKGDGIVQRVLDSADKALNSILKRWTSGKVGTDDAGARLLMMEEDENHIFHARQDCWQYHFGYNDFYDFAFNIGTSMDKAKFTFIVDEKEEYILWAWKGDYINMGAGAELGIYRRLVVKGVSTPQWDTDITLAMPMTLKLSYNGTDIINYDPGASNPQWWITGFNPEYKDKAAQELTATFTVDFKDKVDLYNAFIKSDDYLKNVDKWSPPDDSGYKLTFTFK